MPTYEYECPTHGVFEEYHSMSVKLTHCEKCKATGVEQEIKRLISLGSRGVVELYGQDLVDKLKGDVQKLKGEAAKDEKVYSNLLGEDKYQAMQTKIDRQKRNRR
ncbi:MAG TPA: zinc ribbon domain-containing protein [Candidatus Saccharimonadales bacterium]